MSDVAHGDRVSLSPPWKPSRSVKYLFPASEEHGHWVQPEGEVPRLTRCYVQKAEMVPNEGTWIALEKETVDELSKRRRIREKSSIPPAIFLYFDRPLSDNF